MPDLIVHADELAAKHRVTLRKDRARRASGSAGAKAYPGERLVVTYGINGQRDYFTCLHEMGHVVLGHGFGLGSKLKEEAEAWEWALEMALVGPSLPTREHIGRCLRSYSKGKPTGIPAFDRMAAWAPSQRPVMKTRRLP